MIIGRARGVKGRVRALNNYEIRTNLEHAKYQLTISKGFRDWTLKRCVNIRARSKDTQEINICNLIIQYIQGLNWRDITAQNKKRYEKGVI